MRGTTNSCESDSPLAGDGRRKRQDNSTLRLTEEDGAEVRRRLAEENAKTVTLAEFNESLRRRHGV
jgi:hypothetical protein